MAAPEQDGGTVELKFDTVDVFTRSRYAGNPLAIVHAPANQTLAQEQKQRIADEFNLSETVILHENPDDALDRKVDIFIVGAEIPFAGHPTIGTLCHIGKAVKLSTTSAPIDIKLRVKAGTVHATYDPAQQVARASIPHEVLFHGVTSPAELKSAFPSGDSSSSSAAAAAAAAVYPIVSPVRGLTFVLVELPDTTALSACHPGMIRPMPDIEAARIRPITKPTLLATYFWSLAGVERNVNGMDVMRIDARMMLGGSVPEDPATGSAACTLASALSTWRRGGRQGSGGENEEAGMHKPACLDVIKADASSGLRDRYEITQGKDMGRESHIIVEVVMKADGTVYEIVLSGQAVGLMRGYVTV